MWEWTDLGCRLGIGEVRFVVDVEVLARDCKGMVDGIGTAMSTDGIPAPNGTTVPGHHHRTSLFRVRMTPVHRNRVHPGLVRV